MMRVEKKIYKGHKLYFQIKIYTKKHQEELHLRKSQPFHYIIVFKIIVIFVTYKKIKYIYIN